MRLHLVRHPQPVVAPGICYGASDLAVTADEQARMAALLAPVLPQGAPVRTSPLRRCAEFADRLAASLGSGPAVRDARLREMHFGAWEMQSWNDIPRGEVDAWTNDLVDYRPGGGESVLQAMHRVDAFLHDWRAGGGEDAVVVCHVGTIRLLLAWREGLPLAEAARAAARSAHRVAYGEIVRVEFD